MRKPDFCLCKNKGADQLCSVTRIVQFLVFLNLKFQASSPFLCLYRPVCVRPGGKPQRPVFSRRGSYSYQAHDLAGLLSHVRQSHDMYVIKS